MRVGVVTYHKSLSYGGCLQALATELLLEDMGHEAFFVDYENAYESRKKDAGSVLRYGSLRECLAYFVKNAFFKQSACYRRAFGAFHASLPLSGHKYQSIDEMGDVQADVLLVASDQVWNPLITGGVDPVFFLGFGKAKRRVSFSSSLGSHRLTDDELEQIAPLVQGMDAISVREEFAREQIQPLTEKHVRVVRDPTLQLDAQRWRSIATPVPGLNSSGYVLIFMVSSAPRRFERMVQQVKKRFGLPVLQVRLNDKRPHDVDFVLAATPLELVWLIDNAAFVLTDSFHGLAFSINLETEFALLPNVGNNVRMSELVDAMGLKDRMLDVSARVLPYAVLEDDPEFFQAEAFLERTRKEDLSWLNAALTVP